MPMPQDGASWLMKFGNGNMSVKMSDGRRLARQVSRYKHFSCLYPLMRKGQGRSDAGFGLSLKAALLECRGNFILHKLKKCSNEGIAPEPVGEILMYDVDGVAKIPENNGFPPGFELEQII